MSSHIEGLIHAVGSQSCASVDCFTEVFDIEKLVGIIARSQHRKVSSFIGPVIKKLSPAPWFTPTAGKATRDWQPEAIGTMRPISGGAASKLMKSCRGSIGSLRCSSAGFLGRIKVRSAHLIWTTTSRAICLLELRMNLPEDQAKKIPKGLESVPQSSAPLPGAGRVARRRSTAVCH